MVLMWLVSGRSKTKIKGSEMIKYKNMTKVDYDRCLANMNGEMNLSVFENLYYILEGSNGTHEDTHPDRVVHPTMDCHREFFEDKKRFFTTLIPRLVEKLEPTKLNSNDRVELNKICIALSEARNMIFLVWAADQLLKAVQTNRRKIA